MKSKKLLIILSLVLIFALCLYGCKDKKKDDNSSGTQGQTQTEGDAGKVESISQGADTDEGYTYVITFRDGTTTSISVPRGRKGENGVGIASIDLTSSSGKVDTYTITFTDGSTTNFFVTNGSDGVNGDKGATGDKGDAGRSIVKSEVKDGYLWITYSDSTTPVNVGRVSSEDAGTYGLIYYPLTETTCGVFAGITYELRDIEIPESYNNLTVTTIIEEGFKDAENLVSIKIPGTVTTIGKDAFSGCKNLKSVTIPQGTTTIEDGAFKNCTSLKTVTISDSVQAIGSEAFSGCTSITKVELGNGLVTIKDKAFYGDKRIFSTLTLPSTLQTIGLEAFLGCSRLVDICNQSATITLTAGNNDNGQVAKYAKHIYTEGESCVHVDENGYVFFENGDDVCMLDYIGDYERELTFPDYYNSKSYYICQGAFYGRRGIQTITFGEGVTEIGASAFYNCFDLVTIQMNDSLQKICDRAFFYDTALRNVYLGKSLTYIDSCAFWFCYSIPTIYLPDTLEYIGINAFRQCNALKDFNYEGTVDEWNALDKHNQWDYDFNRPYTIKCSDGNIDVAAE